MVKRVAIPDAVKAVVWDLRDGRCVTCAAHLTPETADYEHNLTVWMVEDPAIYNNPKNIDLICGLRTGRDCHKDKTAKDATDRAKVKRIRRRQSGEVRPPRGRRLQSRGFDTTGPKQKIPSRPFPRRDR